MSDENSSYGRIRERLEDIVVQIRSKEVPLEKSLDLYEEALRLGGMAAELIDNTDFTDDEMAAVEALYDDPVEDFNDDFDDNLAHESLENVAAISGVNISNISASENLSGSVDIASVNAGEVAASGEAVGVEAAGEVAAGGAATSGAATSAQAAAGAAAGAEAASAQAAGAQAATGATVGAQTASEETN